MIGRRGVAEAGAHREGVGRVQTGGVGMLIAQSYIDGGLTRGECLEEGFGCVVTLGSHDG